MRKVIGGGRVFLSALIALIVSMVAGVGFSGDFLLQCQWESPNSQRLQSIPFGSNPLLAVLPGRNIQVTATYEGRPAWVSVLRDGRVVNRNQALNFTAPDKPGAHYINLILEIDGRRSERELCVLVPYRASARAIARGFEVVVDGEQVGQYRSPSTSGNRKVKENPDSYQPPVWWLRITPMNGEFEVVPGVRVRELVATTEETGLRHSDLLPVCYPMWRAIVELRLELEKRGIPGGALRLISMFRAPPYNRMVGSNAFGRHVYGDAFDFYIDLAGSGKAADLNGDGRLDRRDAYPVVAILEDLMDDGRITMGGIGVYNTQGGDHEVTMHYDARGHRATWGYLTLGSGRRSEFCWQSRRFAELDRFEEGLAAAKAAAEGRVYRAPNREPLP